ECFKLDQDLRTRLQARPTTKGHDDVAELARKRTTPGDLQASEHVPVDLQQIDARYRQFGDVRLLLLLIPAFVATPFPVIQEFRPRLVCLADENDSGKACQ